MHKLTDPNTVPPGGFRYTQPETGTVISAPSFPELLSAVQSHRKANGLPLPLEWQQHVEQSMCESLPPGSCRHIDSISANGRHLTWDQIVIGTSTIGEWILSGGQSVSHDEIARRTKICIECPMNKSIANCTTCASDKVRQLADRFLGVKDDRLNTCTVCGCQLRVAVRIPLDILLKHKQNVEIPSHCWQHV